MAEETDPNKLHTLKGELDGYQVYSPEQVESLVSLYLSGSDRDTLDPILDACVAVFKDDAQLFKQFQDNESFRHWLTNTVFGLTYKE